MATASTRTVWKGAISFGLVHIPVALYTAIAETRPRFNLIDRDLTELLKRSLRTAAPAAKAASGARTSRGPAANDEAPAVKRAAASKMPVKARASVKPGPRRKSA